MTPWRAMVVFRFATLAYAIGLTAHNNWRYPHRAAAWVVLGVMVVWTVLASLAYDRARLRAWPMLLVDLAVTAGCVLATLPIVGEGLMAVGVPTLTITWMACPVLAVAVVKGIRWGIGAALLIGACDLGVRGVITQTSVTGTVIMVMAAAALGYLGNIATRAQEQLRQAAALEAAHAERDRLARGIHDSVLQVLALVAAARRGAGRRGGRARAARRGAGARPARAGQHARPRSRSGWSTCATLVGPARLGPAHHLGAGHPGLAAGRGRPRARGGGRRRRPRTCTGTARPRRRRGSCWRTRASAVTVTVRDDGPGIPAGRLEQAAAQGRLGVAQSIRGRLTDLGGVATIASTPGQGTEVELRVPRPR